MVNRIYASGWEEGVERADTHIRQFGVCFLYLLHLQRQAGAAGCGGDARSRPRHRGPLSGCSTQLLRVMVVARLLVHELCCCCTPRQGSQDGNGTKLLQLRFQGNSLLVDLLEDEERRALTFFWHLHAPYCASEGQTTGAELPRGVGLCYFSNSPCCPETLPHSHPPQQSL